MSKVLISSLLFLGLICLTHAAINVPYFSQHDSRWGKQILGEGPRTISKKGCLLSTITSMVAYKGLKVNGQTPNPSRMNAFFKSKNYFDDTILLYRSAEDFGFDFEGIVTSTSSIKKAMNAGKFAHLHVKDGTHWVLATGFISGGYSVMDPGNVTHSYKYSGVVGAAIYSYNGSKNRRLAEIEQVSDDSDTSDMSDTREIYSDQSDSDFVDYYSANIDTDAESDDESDYSPSYDAVDASPISRSASSKSKYLRSN